MFLWYFKQTSTLKSFTIRRLNMNESSTNNPCYIDVKPMNHGCVTDSSDSPTKEDVLNDDESWAC